MPEPDRAEHIPAGLIPAGLKHPRVQEFLAVKRRPASAGLTGPMTLEGALMIGQARAAGVVLRVAFVCPALLRRHAGGPALAAAVVAGGAEGYQVSERVLARLTGRDGTDGLVAIGEAGPRTLRDIRVSGRTRVLIADGWDMPGNLGTLIRCADGAGASGVLVVGQAFGLGHPLVVRASMGAALTMPVVGVGRRSARQWLRAHAFRIVAADPAGRCSYREVDYGGPLAVVVGSERRGVAPEWLAAADAVVAIPMLGSCDSLNAAVAGALLLYEGLAQDSSLPG
jgi:RNA methyltransferase, TrmH family